MAMRLQLDAGGVVTDARVALASVAPRPLRSVDAEASLIGSRLEVSATDAAASTCCERSTQWTTCAGPPSTGIASSPDCCEGGDNLRRRAALASPAGEG